MIDSIRDGGEHPGDRTINGAGRDGSGNYRIDFYSVPVFLLEIIALIGLLFSSYYIHYQYKHQPLVTGVYCDDIAYRQSFQESEFTKKFFHQEHELTLNIIMLILPIVLIIFCELVNSMFGGLSFRQIRALCACCKLHSITRRTLRFSAAYLLGFLILMISCDILANSTGRLRPYFAQECREVYNTCPTTTLLQNNNQKLNFLNNNRHNDESTLEPPQRLVSELPSPSSITNLSLILPPQQTTSSKSSSSSSLSPQSNPISSSRITVLPQNGKILNKRSDTPGNQLNNAAESAILVERHWISLSSKSLLELCPKIREAEKSGFQDSYNRLSQIAMSWPSFPAAILTYAVIFTCSYLSFVGTARPFRLITCVLVMILLLSNMIFNVQLVKEHYNHWEDVVASTILSLVIVTFILYVYLNKFKDSHFYENQKLLKSASGSRRSVMRVHENFRGYSNDGAIGEFNNLDKFEHIDANGSTNDIRSSSLNNGDMVGGSGNDVAMRYFQIPRANYRGAPRPLSSLNQVL